MCDSGVRLLLLLLLAVAWLSGLMELSPAPRQLLLTSTEQLNVHSDVWTLTNLIHNISLRSVTVVTVAKLFLRR